MFGSTWGNNNNQQQQQQGGGLFGGSSGGFGQQQNTGFGQQQNTGFGQQQQNTGGGLFGNNNATTSTGFGGTHGRSNLTLGGGGGFGASNPQSNAFAPRPAFGATGSSPFGAAQQTNTGGGLFGASNTSTGFGSTSNTGGLFGAKPATTGFGASSGGGMFGSQNATATFGQPSNQVFPLPTGPPPPIPSTGTQAPVYQPTWQREPPSQVTKEMPPHLFHVITAMEPYRGGSFEELRMLDYQQNRKEASAPGAAQPAATGFGQPAASGFGAATTSTFGQPAQATTGFGAAAKPGGLFGSSTTGTGFGATSTGGFGQPAATTGGGLFGQSNTTSGFGQQNATSGGLFGQNTQQQNTGTSGGIFGNANPFGQQQQQQQPASTGFGGFGAAAKPAGFGATPAATGFGAPATNTSSVFGQNNSTGSTTTGFGGFGQQQQTQQQPQQQTGGLFGSGGFGQTAQQPATTGGLFGQTNQQPQQQTAGLFGQTQNKPAGGLFGNTNTTSTTGSGFGGFGQSNTTATQPSTGGLFGQTNTTSNTGGGLFGQTQPATAPATGGLFGQTNTASASTGGLFGSKPAAPATGGLFGSTTAQPAQSTTSFGGFGQQQNNSTGGGGLFGQSNQAQAAKPAGGLFGGGGSSLFGQQQNTTTQPASTGGLFGSIGQTQSNTGSGGLFGSSTQTMTQPAQQSSGLFGSALGQSNIGQPQQQQSLNASVDQNPYGRNELFAYSGQKLELGSTNKKPALPPMTASQLGHFRVTPNKSRLTKLRGFASSTNGSQSPGRPASPSTSSTSRSLVGSPVPSDRYKGLTDAALSPNAFLPRQNLKKLTIAPPKDTIGGEDRLDSVFGKSTLRSSANGSAPGTPDLNASLKSPAPVASSSRQPIEDTPTRRPQSAIDTSLRVAATERQLKRGDYWCSPKLEKLRTMSHDELSRLDGFSAGRKGYGEVSFLEPVDLTTLPSLQDMLGKTIIVEDLELTVYPDDKNKPERGQGLNVPARISLENCFARDKSTRQPITDPHDPRYARQVKRIKAMPNTEFVSFSDGGVWTFNVEHFSKYGLLDSDEEEDEDEGMSKTPDRKASSAERTESSYSEDDDDFLPTKGLHDGEVDSEHDSGLDLDESDSYDESMDVSEDYDEVPDMQQDWDRPLKNKLGAQGMQRLREMQSSFFNAPRGGATKRPSAADTKQAAVEAARAIERKRAEAGFEDAEEGIASRDDRAVRRASFGEPASPPLLRKPRKYAKVPLAESSVAGNEGLKPDAGLVLGRSFRCSWGPNGELVHFGKICAPREDYTSSPDAVVYIQQVDLLASPAAVEKPRAERLLKLLLENTQVDVDDDIPAAFTNTAIRFNQFAALFESSDRSHEANIWRLGEALFDEIDLRLPSDTPEEVLHRAAEVRRKLALSKWLEDAVAPAVDADLAAAGDNRPAKVFALLTGNQVERAVQSALDGSDMRLAMLVSQSGGGDRFKEEVQRQLDDWTKFKTNSLIGYDYRKIYAILAGITDVSKGNSGGADAARDVLVAEGLDWKRAFGLYLWHGCAFEQGIADVLASYDEALSSSHPPARPLPPYLEKPDENDKWAMPLKPTDVLFNLIKMYSDLTVSLDNVLEARDASPSPTDFRLPWHLYLLISQALHQRDFADREEADSEGVSYSATANRITSSYAAQLEEEGQWTWAAYVLLHLERRESRKEALKGLLFRHPNPNMTEKSFLVDTLRIPTAWLHEARAASLASEGDAFGEYFNLIPAGLGERAQRALTSKLAPEAVLRDDQRLLRRLCSSLQPLAPRGWEYAGALLLEYVDISTRVPVLLRSVLRAGVPDSAEQDELRRLALKVPRVIQLVPALFNRNDVQQAASLSDMLSGLHSIAAALHKGGYIARPPVTDMLVDKDRLHLLQAAATDSFESSLKALTA